MDELIPRIQKHDQSLVAALNAEEQARLIDYLQRITEAAA